MARPALRLRSGLGPLHRPRRRASQSWVNCSSSSRAAMPRRCAASYGSTASRRDGRSSSLSAAASLRAWAGPRSSPVGRAQPDRRQRRQAIGAGLPRSRHAEHLRPLPHPRQPQRATAAARHCDFLTKAKSTKKKSGVVREFKRRASTKTQPQPYTRRMPFSRAAQVVVIVAIVVLVCGRLGLFGRHAWRRFNTLRRRRLWR